MSFQNQSRRRPRKDVANKPNKSIIIAHPEANGSTGKLKWPSPLKISRAYFLTTPVVLPRGNIIANSTTFREILMSDYTEHDYAIYSVN